VAGSSHEDKFCVLAKIVNHMKTLHQNGADYTLSLEQILDQTNQPDIGMELFDVFQIILERKVFIILHRSSLLITIVA
jgi:hypothetical protein